jgi:hypothetical protein
MAESRSRRGVRIEGLFPLIVRFVVFELSRTGFGTGRYEQLPTGDGPLSSLDIASVLSIRCGVVVV